MKYSLTARCLVLGLSFFTLISCSGQPVSNASIEQCIGSFDTYAYSVPDKNSIGFKITHPLAPWQIETPLPEFANEKGEVLVEATRYVSDHAEIWVKISPSSNIYRNSDAKFYQFLVYRTDTKKWMSISAEVGESKVFVNNLYVAKDGSMWGSNVWDGLSDIARQPILSKYNEVNQKFELDQSTQEIPPAWRNPSPKSGNERPYWDEVLIDSNGIFWIFAQKDAIYSYDPIKQDIQRHAEISDRTIDQVVLAPNGSIYFRKHYQSAMRFAFEENELFHFFPETGKIEEVEIPHKRLPAGNILVDHTGRLWIDTVGWREPDGKWNIIYPNTWLYFWKMEWESDYRWATPNIILESSNGYIWYRGEKGMAWLDPKSMGGCWFTTENTNIVEDQQHNLWMVVDNKLYKYSLNP